MPEKETPVRQERKNSPFGVRAKEVIEKTFAPELKDLADRLVDLVDQQGIENYRFHGSEQFPGVTIGYTVINVDQLKKDAGVKMNDEENTLPETTYVIFPGFGVLKPRAWPFMSWDMVLDRAVSCLSRSGPSKIIILGSELAAGSQITKEWTSAIEQNNFEPLAREYQTIIEAEIPDKNDHRLILNGMSFGCLTARLTAGLLPENLRQQTTLLLDNPVGDHPKAFDAIIRGAQIIAGFVGEGAIRTMLDDPNVTQREKDQTAFWNFLPDHLKGALTDTPDQEKMKQQLTNTETKKIIAGGNIEPISLKRTYIRRGIFDLTTVARAVKKFTREKHFPLKTGHGIYRIRPKQWQRRLRSVAVAAVSESEEEEKK